MKTIVIVVGPDGSSQLETKGFVGAACRDASRLLEAALGAPLSETLTSEYHADVEQPAQEREQA